MCPRFSMLLLLLLAGCGQGKVERIEWTVMGTVAAVQWKGELKNSPEIIAETKGVFADVERFLNAHDPDSELSRLAKLSDTEVLTTCDPSVRPCYEAAFRLRDETGSVFNPRWKGPGTMDLGAIAKGFAVDRAAERIAARCGETEVLIDLGGNLKAVSGTWTTGIIDPGEASEDGKGETGNVTEFALKSGGACATSAEYFRGKHIRDGRDGSEAAGGVVSVTVIHPDSAMMADGLSTVMFLFGKEKGERFLKEKHPATQAIWIK